MVVTPKGGNVSNRRKREMPMRQNKARQDKEQMKIVFIQISISVVLEIDSTQKESNN